MESYIKKINRKIINENDTEKQKKIKQRYLIAGGLTLALGLAGFVASFITFIVLFICYTTDAAFIAWMVAVPFILMIIAGSVVTRIGDMLLREETNKESQMDTAKEVKKEQVKEETKTENDKTSEEVNA